MKKDISKTIQIPNEVQLELALPLIKVKGPKGEVEKKFRLQRIQIQKSDQSITLSCPKANKKEKALLNALAAHLRNLIKGVTEGFEYRLKVCSVHFPITVRLDENKIFIKNFLGETKEREAKLAENVKARIEKDEIILTGPDVEAVAQSAANLEKATWIKAKDRRIFQDGIYIIKKK